MFTKIERAAIKSLAVKYEVPVHWALGLTEVESGGRAFWTVDGKRMPAINLEGHYFYRNLSASDREYAVARGLAHKKAGKTKVPTTYKGRYDMLHRWMTIDRDAALKSISMGVGQVMGEHHARLGFKTVSEMWDTACQSLAGQVDIMLRFCITDAKLLKAIRADNWKQVAYLYNGPAYRKNKYDTKIKNAVLKHREGPLLAKPYDASIELENIKKLGFDTVPAFQRAYGLEADGIIGPITRAAIEQAMSERNKAPAKEAVKVGGAVAGGAGVCAVAVEASSGIVDSIEQLQPVIDLLRTLGTFGPTLVAVGVSSLVVGTLTYMIVRKVRSA